MKKKIILIALAAVIIAGAGGYAYSKSNSKVKQVRLEQVKMEDIEESITLEGMVSPSEEYNLYTELPLTIQELYVKEGDEVKAGTALISFDQRYSEQIIRDMKAIGLDLKNAKLALQNLSSGALQLELDSKKLEIEEISQQVKGLSRELKVVEFELTNLKKEAKVKEDLYEQDSISAIEANQTYTQASKKELEYENIKTELELAKKKYDLLVMGYDRLRMELNLQKSNMESQIAKLEFLYEEKNDELAKVKAELVSPVDGIVTELLAESGGTADPRRKLMTIAPYDNLMVKVDVPVQQVANLKEGMGVNVGSRDNKSEIYKGSVTKVANIAKLVQKENYVDRVVEVEIAMDGTGKLKPGYLVNVEFLGSKKSDILVVDSFSVIQDDGKDYVYVVEDGIVEKKEINTGIKTLSKYEVLNLPEGTSVVMNPFKVKEGEAVKVKN